MKTHWAGALRCDLEPCASTNDTIETHPEFERADAAIMMHNKTILVDRTIDYVLHSPAVTSSGAWQQV